MDKTKCEVIEKIIGLTNYRKMIGLNMHPAQGQFLVTGPQFGSDRLCMIGYCVQVRKGCGQFGSDMVFLRHPDGSLATHENQAYFPMSEVQEQLARSIFVDLPESENYAGGFSCCNKVHEIGFVVERSASQPSPDVVPVSISIKDAAGTECVAFI